MTTKAQERIRTAFGVLIQQCFDEATRVGSRDPHLYFEGGSGLVVFDGPSHTDNGDVRHDAVLFTLPWPNGTKGRIDVGAW